MRILRGVSVFCTVDPYLPRVDAYFTLWIRILHCGSVFYTVDPYLPRVDAYFTLWIRTIAHAISRGPLTPATRVQTQASPPGLHDGHCAAGTGLLSVHVYCQYVSTVSTLVQIYCQYRSTVSTPVSPVTVIPSTLCTRSPTRHIRYMILTIQNVVK